jgi:hypothetical protein
MLSSHRLPPACAVAHTTGVAESAGLMHSIGQTGIRVRLCSPTKQLPLRMRITER